MGKYYQKILTRNLSPIVSFLGIDNLTKPFYSGKGQILMMHRVIPSISKERIHNHLSLEISPEHLENIISFFIRNNYDLISLDNLPGWLESNRNNNKKFVIFTLDDGYKDNLDYAYPVFKKFSTPFTVYITNSFADKSAILWWYIIEDMIIKNKNVAYSFSDFKINLDCSNYRKRETAFARLRDLIMKFDEHNLEQELTGFFSKFGYSVNDYNIDVTLNWDEISQLSKDPLVTIGSHTLNHYNLCNLTNDQSLHEISESKIHIELKINTRVNHFSYPLGKYTNREMEYAERCNFLTATTTKNANIFYNHIEHQFALPRISINALSNEKVLNLHINGFFPAILHKFRRIVY
jgi:peptidoglycan/xylan/chitin deacetylase (PgdA/CDA1 family)